MLFSLSTSANSDGVSNEQTWLSEDWLPHRGPRKMTVPGPDPIKLFSAYNSTLCYNQPIREAKIGHVVNLIGQIQRRVELNAEKGFIGSGPVLKTKWFKNYYIFI